MKIQKTLKSIILLRFFKLAEQMQQENNSLYYFLGAKNNQNNKLNSILPVKHKQKTSLHVKP